MLWKGWVAKQESQYPEEHDKQLPPATVDEHSWHPAVESWVNNVHVHKAQLLNPNQ